ncbi:cytochrome c biogenesis protein CcdA, partial [Mycolicibacterium fortuitum]
GTLAVAGLAISAGARALISAAPWLGLVVGVALVLLGVVMFTGRVLGLRLPTRALRPATGPGGTTGIVLAGIGYAAASLSCTFGVLLAVIAQAQATAGWGALLAVFVAYTLGAATILLLVSLAAAAAGTALTHHLAALARHGTRITATVLILTGAYLAWYWLPAVTGDTTGTNGFAALSTTASTWLQNHTPLMATIAALTVLTAAVTVLAHRMIRRRVTDAAPVDCCTPTTVIEEGRP